MASSSSSIVPFIPGGSVIIQQMGLSRTDQATLERGLTYLRGDQVQEWVAQRRDDLQRIVETAQSSVAIAGRLQQVGSKIQGATQELGVIEEERKDVSEQEHKERTKFEEDKQGLDSELETVRDSLRDESKIALFACTNPLTTRVGRMVAYLGRQALNVTVPLLGVIHRDTLAENCSKVLSATVTTTMQCASTAARASFYIPLVFAAGTAALCSYAYKAGTRILKKQQKAEALQGQIDARTQTFKAKESEFKQQNQQLSDRNADNRRVLQDSESERKELDDQKSKTDAVMGSLRGAIMDDIVRRNITQVEETFTDTDYTPALAERVGSKAMQNIFDAMVVKFSGNQRQLAAIGSSKEVLQIQES